MRKIFKAFFSFEKIQNNLEYLKIYMFNIFTISLINENILTSNLNNFNLLNELKLYKLWFCSNFTFKLNNLQKLVLYQY